MLRACEIYPGNTTAVPAASLGWPLVLLLLWISGATARLHRSNGQKDPTWDDPSLISPEGVSLGHLSRVCRGEEYNHCCREYLLTEIFCAEIL